MAGPGENSLNACLSGLDAFNEALRGLDARLSHGRVNWNEVWEAVHTAHNALVCPQCQGDGASAAKFRVFALLGEVRLRWEDWRHPCHEELTNALKSHLSGTPRNEWLNISKLRFTQSTHSEVFRHGDHAGHDINWLVDELNAERVCTSDASMVIHAVLFHGRVWALNNRHAVALVRYQNQHASQKECRVRIWPLLRGVRLDDGSRREVVEKFADAYRPRREGRSIRGTSRSPSRERSLSKTRIRDGLSVHVRNLDFGVTEPELRAHIIRAGHRTLEQVTIQLQDSGRAVGRSAGHALVDFASPEAAHALVELGLPALRGRIPLVQLDSVTSAASRAPTAASSGWVRCRRCMSTCAALMDVYLVEGIRPRGPGYAPNTNNAYHLTCAESAVMNCHMEAHPDRETLPFKLMLVQCAACGADLGNIQDSTLIMEGEWREKLGTRLMCFKCKTVMLELADNSQELVDVKKWSILYPILSVLDLGDCRLSGLTMAVLGPQLRRPPLSNSNRDIRVIPRP